MDDSCSLSSDFSCDSFLGGRVRLYQPRKGYRAGIDAVFLSACVQPSAGQSILDVGAGVGTASILLLIRAAEKLPFSVCALEKEKILSELSEKNALLNNVSEFLTSVSSDLNKSPPEINQKSFDQVMTNPPFFEGTMISPHALKAKANHPSSVSFEAWIDFCIKRLKSFGTLTLIIPPQRLPSFLKMCEGRLGDLHIYPLWQRTETPAKRLLIQGVKDRKTPLKLLSGLVLHETDRAFTSEAHDVLWEGKSLILR